MTNTRDHANVAYAGELSQAAQYATEHYRWGRDDAARPDATDRAVDNASDFGLPLEDWKVD